MKELSIPSEFRRFPKQWKVMPFLEVISDETGGNPKVLTSDYLDSGTLPVIDQGNSAIAGYVNDVSLKCKAKLPCILFGDHTKNFKFVDHHFALGADGVKVLIPSADLDSKFVFHYLKQVRLPDNAGYSRHFKFLKEAYIPLPPLPEQKRIAAILDKADSIRRKRQEAVRLTEELLRSVFLDMFGDPVTNPKGIKNVCLSEVTTRITDGTHLTPKFIESGVPFIFVKNIKNGKIDFQTDKYISEEEHKKLYERCPVEEGDILYTTVGATYGQAVAVGSFTKFAFQRHVAHVKPDKSKVLSDYLGTIMQLPIVKNQADRWARGAAQPTVNLTELREFVIPLPPLHLQSEFAQKVAAVEKLKTVCSLPLEHAETLFNSLLQRALVGNL